MDDNPSTDVWLVIISGDSREVFQLARAHVEYSGNVIKYHGWDAEENLVVFGLLNQGTAYLSSKNPDI